MHLKLLVQQLLCVLYFYPQQCIQLPEVFVYHHYINALKPTQSYPKKEKKCEGKKEIEVRFNRKIVSSTAIKLTI